jgi:hypothetical protein
VSRLRRESAIAKPSFDSRSIRRLRYDAGEPGCRRREGLVCRTGRSWRGDCF